jgi:hypothetical protein
MRESLSHKLTKFTAIVLSSLNMFSLQSVFILLKIKTLMDLPLWTKLADLQNWPKTYTNKPERMDPNKPWAIAEK